MVKRQFSRRGFLKSVAAAGTAAAFPSIVPASVLGADAPSNKIVMGAIGVGSMGSGDLNGFLGKGEVRVVAVCDVDSNHYTSAKNRVDGKYGNKDCKTYLDFRDLIGRGDLDAVMTALPDHWHAIPAIEAAKAGLDIHGQKPFARSIREGRAICDAVHRYGRVWQTGSQQRSGGQFRRACELVRNGRIGKISHVEVGLPTGGSRPPMKEKAVPANLDWDFWLGPAPWRPFVDFGNGGVHWNWRWVMDYSGGQLTDWAGHHIDIAHWGLGFDKTGPVAITEAKGIYPKSGTYNTPTSFKFKCTYENGVEMVVANKSQQPKGQGTCWYGENGQWIYVNRGGLRASSRGILKSVIGPGEKRLYKSRDHKQNFIDCIISREETITPAETAHRSISAALLGEIAMLTGKDLKWDPVKEEFIGNAIANRYLSRPMRSPWHL
jgi:predicted dehydrogenase